MYRFNQHSFVGGQLDRGLMGRQDLERYFQGASKLENFIVRKQGNITKRRGSEMMADLGDLFGTGDAIAYSRIIPFSQEISSGYYLLFAESTGQTPKRGVFVLSDKGLQHKYVITKTKLDADGNETSEKEEVIGYNEFFTPVYTTENSTEQREIKDESGNIVGVETWKVVAVTTPYSLDLPYHGSQYDDIGFTQSGDTLFLVHKGHPPLKVVNASGRFSKEKLDLGYNLTGRPELSVKTSNGFSGTGTARKVSYVCTAVTDGVESLPSYPCEFEYKLPWPNTAVLELLCGMGTLKKRPNYFNIYKSTGGEYGLILSTIGKQGSVAIPTIIGYENAGYIGLSGSVTEEKLEQGLHLQFHDILQSYIDKLFVAKPSISEGGVCNANVSRPLLLHLERGWKVVRVEAYVDCYHIFTVYSTLAYPMGSGDTVKCDLHVQSGEKTTTLTVSSYAPVPYFLITPDGAKYLKPKDFDTTKLRRMVFEFDTSELGKDWWVESIAFSSTHNGNPVAVGLQSVTITVGANSHITSATPQDDYITPNFSFSPPVEFTGLQTAGNYPSCVTVYTQRLAFAATERQPFTWWMSCIGDFNNFATHATIRQDDAMEVTVPATEFPNINHMVLSRDLVLFCDNGEWLVRPLTGNTLAYDTVECKKQSAIGCAKSVPPLQVGDEIIFADNSKRVVRSIKYQFTSDGYESNDLSILSQSIFFMNPVVSMCYKQHPESLILCELSDGTVAALVYMKEHNVVAWTHHTLGGGWKCRGIASNKAHAEETTHVAMLVEHPYGGTEVWRIRDDSESANLADQLCMDGLRFALGSEIGAAAFENGQAVINLENGERLFSVSELDADKEYAVGYPFTSTFASVRPEPQGAETFQWELKNAKKVHIRTLNGSSFTVKEAGMADDYASKVEIERNIEGGTITKPGLVDATDILLNGENSRDGRIEIKHDGILPLTIESFSVDYETQPLYGSEG